MLAAPGVAGAHLNGIPTIAWPQSPSGVGEVADDSYRISWIDYDDRATTGETTIDIHASRRMPPTYRMGVVPRIEGDPDHLVIAEGIQEKDLRNQVEWDTSSVPAGTWFVWTVAHDDPFEMWAFARGAVSVAHDGERPWPAVIVTRPDENSAVGDEMVVLAYESFDPEGTAAVRLEATRALDGSGLVVIAEDLPAHPTGSFLWDTRDVEEGDWTIQATITDARGLSSSAFGRSFVRVQHRSKGTGGAGGAAGAGGGGAAGAAGGMGGVEGSGADAGDDPGAGCGCGAAPGDAMGLALAALLLLRSKRAGCGSTALPPA
ncbi:MAG TPA: hypothetical protein VN033_15980 [Vulgatibacter sp.]|nr:hypothetical protein [Vulgatibacter sp.]